MLRGEETRGQKRPELQLRLCSSQSQLEPESGAGETGTGPVPGTARSAMQCERSLRIAIQIHEHKYYYEYLMGTFLRAHRTHQCSALMERAHPLALALTLAVSARCVTERYFTVMCNPLHWLICAMFHDHDEIL